MKKVYLVLYGDANVGNEMVVIAESRKEAIAKAERNCSCKENFIVPCAIELAFNSDGCSREFYIGQ